MYGLAEKEDGSHGEGNTKKSIKFIIFYVTSAILAGLARFTVQ